MRRVGVIIATAGGAGYFPVAPGTVGSAVGLVVYFISRGWPILLQAGLLLAIVVVGIWASGQAVQHFKREDPGHVVIDEVAGQLVTLFSLNVTILGAVAGFLIFRVLDIFKPWPARDLERLPSGSGVMADDLMAGLYGWVLMWGLIQVVSGLA
jgi:phosphatidylglycerophosphatase A